MSVGCESMVGQGIRRMAKVVVTTCAVVALIACLMVTCLSGCTSGSSSSTGTTSAAAGDYSSGTHHATIVIADYGTIEVELDADTAPITVANFAKLVNEGFYNGLTIHRVVPGFCIQGGDPAGNGTGGSDQTIKGEFSANGVENDISHVRGTISMARSTDNDSASSQFFIVLKDATQLDGNYAAFGHVTSGMDVCDRIAANVPRMDSNGTVAAADQPVITSITMVD